MPLPIRCGSQIVEKVLPYNPKIMVNENNNNRKHTFTTTATTFYKLRQCFFTTVSIVRPVETSHCKNTHQGLPPCRRRYRRHQRCPGSHWWTCWCGSTWVVSSLFASSGQCLALCCHSFSAKRRHGSFTHQPQPSIMIYWSRRRAIQKEQKTGQLALKIRKHNLGFFAGQQ